MTDVRTRAAARTFRVLGDTYDRSQTWDAVMALAVRYERALDVLRMVAGANTLTAESRDAVHEVLCCEARAGAAEHAEGVRAVVA